MGNTVTSHGWIKCPKCGRWGQLQHYRVYRRWYWRCVHYKGNNIELKDTKYWKTGKSGFRGKYDYTCYLGKDYY
jgi:hypothetical protein